MYFVALGSQKFQFNRLLIAIDKMVEEGTIKEKVFAQIGYSDYTPKNYEYKDFINRNEFLRMESISDVVITHGGTGAIVEAIKMGKKVIAIPRLAKYGEHVDDHQVQIIKQFDENGLIEACYDTKDLKKSLQAANLKTYKKYISNTSNIIRQIEIFLEEDFNQYNGNRNDNKN